jgi:histidinol-phosphate aminotransferase
MTGNRINPSSEQLVKLASNENPWGPTEEVKARVIRAVAEIGSYPQADGFSLRNAIALRRGVNPDQIILGNGSAELIEMAAKAIFLNGGSGVAPRHSYALYGLATRTAGGRFIESAGNVLEQDADSIMAAVQRDTRIVFLGHPNNPTGTRLDAAGLQRLVEDLRDDIVLVVDQAYAEYEDPDTYPDAAEYLGERANLLVLHSFSKIHGLAGLRIGYALGQPDVLGLLERVRSPFNTNHLAQVAAEEAIGDYGFEAFCRKMNAQARAAFLLEADRHRCTVSGQGGNFLLMETMLPAQELFRDLLRKGIIIRPLDSHGLPNHIRVTLGLPEQMEAFWAAIAPILDQTGCGCF